MQGSVNSPGTSWVDLEAIRAEIIKGEVSMDLLTSDGKELCTDAGVPLLATRRLDLSAMIRQEIAAAVALHNNSQSAHPGFLAVT